MRRSQLVKLDDAGHVVAYHVIRPDRDPCAEGFFRGVWKSTVTDDGRQVGRMMGRFVLNEGGIRGFMRGVFGVRIAWWA